MEKMETFEFHICRLCGERKCSDEIIAQLDNKSFDIETKLIVCCQWNTFSEITSEKLTRNVCIECYQSLQQCWYFAEQVRCVQLKLLSNLECTVEDDNQHDSLNELSTISDNDIQPSLSSDEEHFTTIDLDVKNDLDSQKSAHVIKFEEASVTEQHELECIQSEKQDKTSKPFAFNERNFLEAVTKDDRNSDGTVKPEAIQRLGLENWAIVQYRCYLCQKRLLDRYEWRNHMKIEHPGYQIRHLCNICNIKSYTVRAPLLRHVMNKHRQYLKHCCTNCNTFYWNLYRLRKHSSRCKLEPSKLSLCDICGKEYKTESMLRVHRRSHSADLKHTYECYMCGKSRLSRQTMKHHVLMTHVLGKPQYKCDHCGKEFSRKGKCNQHMKIHLNNFPFECPHCSKKFRFNHGLKTHIRTHTGDRPYQCIVCSYRCADSGNLVKHMRQVHGATKTEILQRQSMQ